MQLVNPLPNARWHDAFSSYKVLKNKIPVLLIGESNGIKAT